MRGAAADGAEDRPERRERFVDGLGLAEALLVLRQYGKGAERFEA